MKRLDKVPKEDIKEDFLAVADRFVDYVYDCGKVKEIFGKSIQGETFCFLIERYLAMVQDGSLVIENAFDYVIKHTNSQAVKQAIEELGNHFNVRLPISESDVQAIADQAMTSAMDVFNSKAINVNDQEDEVSKLIKLINDACIDFASKNFDASFKLSEQEFKKLFSEVESKLRNQEYIKAGGYNDWMEDLNKTFHDFDQLQLELGPAKWSFVEDMQSKVHCPYF